MPRTLKEIYAGTRALTREQAVELMDLLLIDTFSEGDPVVDAAWGREIDRRVAEVERGEVKGIPGDEVMARARKIVDL